jgi:ribokinase
MSSKPEKTIDVLGVGAVSVDFFGCADQWPHPGEKQRMHGFSIQDGGLVGTALVAVSRLGGRASFVGELGFSDMAERAVRQLECAGVDTSFLRREAGREPCVSFVIATGEGQRTIFSSHQGTYFPSPDSWIDQSWYKKVKVLLIDHVSGRAGIEAAKIARIHGVPVVIDAERNTNLISEALIDSDHLVVPHHFAYLYTSAKEIRTQLHKMRTRSDQVVIITCGSVGCYGLVDEEEFHLPAFPVEVVDTTGCGDVFHGTYALKIAQGSSVLDSARFASAASALSATQVGGRSGIPTVGEVEKLLFSQ